MTTKHGIRRLGSVAVIVCAVLGLSIGTAGSVRAVAPGEVWATGTITADPAVAPNDSYVTVVATFTIVSAPVGPVEISFTTENMLGGPMTAVVTGGTAQCPLPYKPWSAWTCTWASPQVGDQAQVTLTLHLWGPDTSPPGATNAVHATMVDQGSAADPCSMGVRFSVAEPAPAPAETAPVFTG